MACYAVGISEYTEDSNLKLQTGGWYVKRNGCVVGPVVKISDTSFDFWIPTDNFRCYHANGKTSKSAGAQSEHDLIRHCEHLQSDRFLRISSEFGSYIASIVCGMVEIHLSKTIQYEHLVNIGSFTCELEYEFGRVFYTVAQVDPDIYSLALKCWSVLYGYEIGLSLGGLGGCRYKSLRELIDNT